MIFSAIELMNQPCIRHHVEDEREIVPQAGGRENHEVMY